MPRSRIACWLLASLVLTPAAAGSNGEEERPLYYGREITAADLQGRSLYELTLLRNTIFARAGNRFRKRWLHEYFGNRPWYKPTGLDESRLTELDRKNAERIAAYEAALPRQDLAQRREALLERHRWAWLPLITALAFSPDGKLLLSGHRDGRVALWEVPSGRLARLLREEPGREVERLSLRLFDEVVAVAFSADGRTAVAGTFGGTLLRWRLDAVAAPSRTELVPAPSPEVERQPVCRLVLSSGGGVAVFSAESADLSVQRLPEGQRLTIPRPEATSMWSEVAISPDGKLGLWFDHTLNGTMAFFDTGTGRLLRTLDRPNDAYGAAFSQDGSLLALAGRHQRHGEASAGKIWLVDVATGALLREAEMELLTYISAVAFSPEGKKLFALDEQGTLAQWEVGATRWSWPASRREEDQSLFEPTAALAVSPDGRWVAAAVGEKGERNDLDGQPRLIDASTGRPAEDWKGHEPIDWTGRARLEVGLLSRALGLADPFPPEEETSPLDDPILLDQPVTVKQLADLSPRDLRILRNMIYARRGRPFRSRVLQDYFGRMEWYTPDPDYTDARLTRLDHQNIRVIQSVEAELGGPISEDEHAAWFFRA